MTNPLASIYNFWLSTPAPIREPIKSAVVSTGLGLATSFSTMFGSGFQAGAFATPDSTWTYISRHAWGAFIGFVVGTALSATYRARQAKSRVSNTVTLPDGKTAVLVPPSAGGPPTPPPESEKP